MRCPRLIHLVPSMLAVAFLPSLSSGQVEVEDDPCTWETCALRVERRFFGSPKILAGVEEREVAKLGFFPPPLPLFGERSDTAAVFYDDFRVAQKRSNVLELLGGIAFAVGSALVAQEEEIEAGAAAALGLGVAFRTGSSLFGLKARRHLSRAVWWYNGTLPGEERLPSDQVVPDVE